jgi:branched-chain amino acid transport system ATP-binding protein
VTPTQGELRVEHLFAGYDRADVLEDVSLTVMPGSITCLLGSNGSGKTTLIRSILGLTLPRRGQIWLDGIDLTRLATHEIIAQGIACIPEGRRVFPKLTVLENLRVGAYLQRKPEVVRGRLEQVFASFPRLAERRNQLGGTLSGGEQAMLSIGRGLMGAPRLLLVDEPSLGLSPLLVNENFGMLTRINRQGVTVFLVEQNVHQTLAIADRGYVLSQGKVIVGGSAAELANDQRVRQAYFGKPSDGAKA